MPVERDPTKRKNHGKKKVYVLPDISGDVGLRAKKFTLARSEHAPVIIELLKDCRTMLTSVIADDEFKTLVNALTLEIESKLIQRVVITIEKIRNEGTNAL